MRHAYDHKGPCDKPAITALTHMHLSRIDTIASIRYADLT